MIQNADEAIEQRFDDSTLDDREAAGLKSLVIPGELERWFGEMSAASRAKVLDHLRHRKLVTRH